jgi:hypothetical protein
VTLVVILFTFQIALACVISDITLIFGFFAAISENVFNFILPAIFYIVSTRMLKNKFNISLLAFSILSLMVGTFIFVVNNYENVLKIIDEANRKILHQS